MNPILFKFYDQLRKFPNHYILYSNKQKYTIKDIENFSNNIANRIHKVVETYIPFYIKNDSFLLPVILGILKANKIPIPLNTALNLGESQKQISDLNYNIIITDDDNFIDNINLLIIDHFILGQEKLTFNISNYNDITYCIMTSGTTGTPKKILLTGDNLCGILNEYYNIIELSVESKVLMMTPATFDVSLSEILAPVFTGAKLICFGTIASDINKKIRHTLEYIKQYSVTNVFLAPAFANLVFSMGDKNNFKSLSTVSIAGEKFPLSLKKLLKNRLDTNKTKVFNLYGPAETTLFATYYRLSFKENDDIPIGRPFKNVLLLSEKGDNNDIELYIGGIGVSRGYTDKNITENYFKEIDGIIYYKTGDYVYINHNEDFVFKCRKDSQIKLNGVRIELDSIDDKLAEFSLVKEVKTIYHNEKIYSFIVLHNNNDKNQQKIKETIKNTFPKNYAIRVRFINKLPLTTNRKIDINRLKISCNSTLSVMEKSSDIKEIITNILNKSFEALTIRELDSLDLVRFFLEIERKFNIIIPDNSIVSLKNMDNLIDFIICQNDNLDAQNDFKNICYKVDLENLKTIFEIITKFKGISKDTLYIQKNYFEKDYHSVLFFDISLDEKILIRLGKLFDVLSKNFDITKLLIDKHHGNVYFRYVECLDPIIFYSTNILKEHDISKLMFTSNTSPLFFVNISETEGVARFYFSHAIIDKYKLYRLGEIIRSYLYEQKEIKVSSNYIKFIEFIKTQSKQNSHYLQECIPITKHTIPDLHSHGLLFEFEIDNKMNSLDLTILSIYFISKIYFKENKQVNTLTGSLIENIDEFDGFDSINTIGDMHSTIPYFINRCEHLTSFSEKIYHLVNLYAKGISIREMIFENYPNLSKNNSEYKKLWEKMNFSVNYIGEIKNLDSELTALTNDNYSSKYLIIMTKGKNVFIYTPRGIELSNEYHIDNHLIKVSKIQMDNTIKRGEK
ncbi:MULTISPECIES: AMP-binding protein [unclassified Granulicatella]|uniref:non-ribosomal peptide synthetase n=1 Tax=unclassified Granulicatella TaxID=2630493 RepID=UPI001073D829|nr:MULTISPECIES: AMP-binding protein [unclassified Granulicatella]MBF0780527.1 AMP-binding protein [Granulicatella sp. 19428wC4_WM01]TFU94932.1 hypothetical protein E4T68_05405 [Granulicatella sp. WM01]